MKFVDQNLLEVGALLLAYVIAENRDDLNSTKHELFLTHKEFYPGDQFWVDQAVEVAEYVYETAKTIAPSRIPKLILLTQEIRKTLDDNLKPVGQIRNLLGGTLFSKSHPAPQDRTELGKKNLRALLIAVNSKLDD
jgi:hypothetical protein